MDEVIVADTIRDIVRKMRFLSDSGHPTTTEIINHLLEVEEVIAEAENINNAEDDELQEWLGQVKDLVNDLYDLVEEEPRANSPRNGSGCGGSVLVRVFPAKADSRPTKTDPLDEELRRLAEQYKTKFTQSEGILGTTLEQILQRLSSHPYLARQDVTEITDHLSELKQMVVGGNDISKAQRADWRKWLRRVEVSVNDLSYLVEKLPMMPANYRHPRKTPAVMRFFPVSDHEVSVNDGRTTQIREVSGKLAGLVEEYNTKFIKSNGEIQEAAAAQNGRDSTELSLHDTSLPNKLCFAYCSLFPKGHTIDVPGLISLWMAEGFLPGEYQDQEDLGKYFVRRFLDDSIFENPQEDECSGIKSCTMKPEMHDLAAFMGRHESIRLDPNGEKVREGVRRVSFDYSLDIVSGIPDSLFHKAKKLRTILLPAIPLPQFPTKVKMSISTCESIFSHFENLRVLDLHNLGIRTVPNSIATLKNLRWLDLSENNIEKLPGSITKLSNLQTLKLSRCYALKELPKDLGDLKKLRHLELEGCADLTHMPTGIKHLTSLRTLSNFVVSNSHSGGLEELASLKELTGHLEILHLEQLKLKAADSSNQPKFYLKEKSCLEGLTLTWYHDNIVEKNKVEESSSQLELLQPHEKLKVFFIVGYQGELFQDWLSSLKNLAKFSLYNCPGLKDIPPLHELPLKILKLQRLNSLIYIDQRSKSTSEEFFKFLEELTISDCPELTSWWKTDNVQAKFPCISRLEVQYCPKLSCMPLYPSLDEKLVLVSSSGKPLQKTTEDRSGTNQTPLSKLKSVVIANVEDESPQEWIENLTSLQDLHIRDCPLLKSLPKGLTNLISLTVENCEQLDLPRDALKGLRKLRNLTVRGIPKLTGYFPSELDDLSSLHNLQLHSCHKLMTLPYSIQKLTSLRKLEISECANLVSLPDVMNKLTSLQTLIISDCRWLLPKYQRETGEDWLKIPRTVKITVNQTFSYL